jgi:hypothetical protein
MTVTDIAPDRVMLTLGDESEGLALRVAAGPRTTIQPAQPQGPQGQTAPAVGQRPVAPPGAVAANPALPANDDQPAVVPAGPDAEARSLLERRRAARAAQAAAEAAARANNTAPAPAVGQPPGGGDANWAEVYRRMQQPRR